MEWINRERATTLAITRQSHRCDVPLQVSWAGMSDAYMILLPVTSSPPYHKIANCSRRPLTLSWMEKCFTELGMWWILQVLCKSCLTCVFRRTSYLPMCVWMTISTCHRFAFRLGRHNHPITWPSPIWLVSWRRMALAPMRPFQLMLTILCSEVIAPCKLVEWWSQPS